MTPAVTAAAVAAAAAPVVPASSDSGPFDFIADALESLLKVGFEDPSQSWQHQWDRQTCMHMKHKRRAMHIGMMFMRGV